MNNNTEGLSPSLRPFLGVGWNRPLPNAFAFHKKLILDGVNDRLDMVNLEGTTMPMLFSFEFWWEASDLGLSGNVVSSIVDSIVSGVEGYRFEIFFRSGDIGISVRNFNNLSSVDASTFVLKPNSSNIRIYFATTIDRNNNTIQCYCNGVYNLSTNYAAISNIDNANIIRFNLVQNHPELTEFRYYNRIISYEEMKYNYNNGLGNNPQKTEGLIAWHRIQSAESELALYPGGSPLGWTSGAWGIRDKSGNNNHLMQTNMANDATLGGAIQSI